MASDSTEPAFDWGDALDEEPSNREAAIVPQGSGVRLRGGVTLAVFGGLYAVWSIAWVIAIAALPDQPASSLLDAVMYQFGEFLAIIVTPAWLGASFWFLPGEALGKRLWAQVFGLLVLFPWPLVLPLLLGR